MTLRLSSYGTRAPEYMGSVAAVSRLPFLQTLFNIYYLYFLMMAIQLFLKKPANYFLIGIELIVFDNHTQNNYMLIRVSLL